MNDVWKYNRLFILILMKIKGMVIFHSAKVKIEGHAD